MLDLKRVRVLSEVVRQGSFSAAADSLHLSQSAVSQQVATLEREVGMSLLERTRNGPKLNHAGRVLVGHAEAALARLEELVDEDWVREDTAERLRGLYGFRRSRFLARFDGDDDGSIEQRSANYQRLRRELLEAERAAIVQLRRDGRISDDVMRRIERDLDLEDSRLDV